MRKGHDQQLVDVICQHNKDGSMIPIRVRLTDEDGAVQTYTIKNYEDLSHQGTRTMPDGMYVTDRTFVYECQVQAFGRYRMIQLHREQECTGDPRYNNDQPLCVMSKGIRSELYL